MPLSYERKREGKGLNKIPKLSFKNSPKIPIESERENREKKEKNRWKPLPKLKAGGMKPQEENLEGGFSKIL